MDQNDVPDNIRSDSRRYGPIGGCSSVDDLKSSEMRLLTGTLKADWIQLPVKRYLTVFPTLKQGVIAGLFRIKGASPWAISVFLLTELWMIGIPEFMPCPQCGQMSP